MSWSTTLKNRQLIRTQLAAGEDIAVMFSDIRGFASYTAKAGDRAAWRLARLHETLLRDEIEGHNGILVKTLGDGVMAAFAEPRDGITAAVAIQHEIRKININSTDVPIDVGIGLASGTPVMTETDLFGNSVNTAQRLSGLAKGGQILVTKEIKEAVPLKDGLSYIPLGKRDLKGVGEEEIYEVAWMNELIRISDVHDRITIVLTARGSVVVKPAKKLENTNNTLIGRVSALLKLRKSDTVNSQQVNREYPVTEVSASLHRRTLLIRLGRKLVPLHGVNPDKAREFIDRLESLKKERNEAQLLG